MSKLMSKFPWIRLSVGLIPLLTIFLSVGWKAWLAIVPIPLPAQSAIAPETPLLSGKYYETAVPPTGTEKYISAEYRLWIPAGVQTLRGLLIRQHGCGDAPASTGLDYANDLQWQALALKHQFALLGTKLPTGNRLCDEWAEIDRGSGNAFLKALRTLAQTSHHPELAQVPWALWGHSGGADWVIELLQKYPARTIGVVAARCGGSTFPDHNDPALVGVPVLFAVAAKENTYVDECRDLPKRIFLRYRKTDALWAVAEEANTAHEAGDTRFLAIPYLDALITARLAADHRVNPPKDKLKLRAIAPKQGWLANPTTHTIAPASQYPENPLEAAWLPNEETARKWQDYVTTGKITPTQPLAAPTQVRMAKIEPTGVILTWHYLPDLENGLPSFRIYRDDLLIKTLRGQAHNFSDAPEFPQVALEFRDQDGAIASKYTVGAFNHWTEQLSQPAQLTSLHPPARP